MSLVFVGEEGMEVKEEKMDGERENEHCCKMLRGSAEKGEGEGKKG